MNLDVFFPCHWPASRCDHWMRSRGFHPRFTWLVTDWLAHGVSRFRCVVSDAWFDWQRRAS